MYQTVKIHNTKWNALHMCTLVFIFVTYLCTHNYV